jgi:S-adenosylmethionine-dependent carboxyl methyltransferase
MPNESPAPHGVMEGGGAYNQHARVPAGGGTLALPFLEQAVQNVVLDGGDTPLLIADYGSSQGKNSLAPMRAAIKALRSRVGPVRPISVVHIDQAANDFNTLFDLLHRDPERYSVDDPNIFPSAIGRSFYESVLPREQVHLGWSSYAAVWLSRIPMSIPGHFISLASTGEVHKAFERQAADDWRLFLSLRSGELRAGGRLVVVLPGLNDEGATGFEPLFQYANSALAELVSEGTIAEGECAQMVLGAYPRRECELLAPFAADGKFIGLTVEHCEVSCLPDSAWNDYEREANKELLASRHASFFRSIFVPSLASALTDSGKRQVFADAMEQKLKRCVAKHPAPMHSFVQTLVLAKRH